MKENYKTYRAEQLLNDSSFIAYLHKSDPDNNVYWEKIGEAFPVLKKEMELAERIWTDMKETEEQRNLSSVHVRLLWKQIEHRNRVYDQQKKRKYHLIAVFSGVAAIVLLFLFISIWNDQEAEVSMDYQAILMQPDNCSGKDQITLILSDKQELMFEETEINIDYNEAGLISVRTGEEGKIEEKQTGQGFNQVIVPRGKRTFLTLSDGTQVWVNAGTKLIYPVVFAEKKREIYVEGEVFLDVTEDKKNRF